MAYNEYCRWLEIRWSTFDVEYQTRCDAVFLSPADKCVRCGRKVKLKRYGEGEWMRAVEDIVAWDNRGEDGEYAPFMVKVLEKVLEEYKKKK